MAQETIQLEFFQYQEIVAGLSMIAGVLEEMHVTLKEMRDATTRSEAEADGTKAHNHAQRKNGPNERTETEI